MRLTGLNNNNAEQGDSHVEQWNTGEIGVTQVENLALIPAQEITVAEGGHDSIGSSNENVQDSSTQHSNALNVEYSDLRQTIESRFQEAQNSIMDGQPATTDGIEAVATPLMPQTQPNPETERMAAEEGTPGPQTQPVCRVGTRRPVFRRFVHPRPTGMNDRERETVNEISYECRPLQGAYCELFLQVPAAQQALSHLPVQHALAVSNATEAPPPSLQVQIPRQTPVQLNRPLSNATATLLPAMQRGSVAIPERGEVSRDRGVPQLRASEVTTHQIIMQPDKRGLGDDNSIGVFLSIKQAVDDTPVLSFHPRVVKSSDTLNWVELHTQMDLSWLLSRLPESHAIRVKLATCVPYSHFMVATTRHLYEDGSYGPDTSPEAGYQDLCTLEGAFTTSFMLIAALANGTTRSLNTRYNLSTRAPVYIICVYRIPELNESVGVRC